MRSFTALFIPQDTIVVGIMVSCWSTVCLSVHLSVVCPSVYFLFADNNLSKCQWIFTKLGCAVIFWKSGFGSLMGKFHQFLTELSAFNTIMAGYYHFTFLFHLELLFFKASIHNSPLHFFSDSFKNVQVFLLDF